MPKGKSKSAQATVDDLIELMALQLSRGVPETEVADLAIAFKKERRTAAAGRTVADLMKSAKERLDVVDVVEEAAPAVAATTAKKSGKKSTKAPAKKPEAKAPAKPAAKPKGKTPKAPKSAPIKTIEDFGGLLGVPRGTRPEVFTRPGPPIPQIPGAVAQDLGAVSGGATGAGPFGVRSPLPETPSIKSSPKVIKGFLGKALRFAGPAFLVYAVYQMLAEAAGSAEEDRLRAAMSTFEMGPFLQMAVAQRPFEQEERRLRTLANVAESQQQLEGEQRLRDLQSLLSNEDAALIEELLGA